MKKLILFLTPIFSAGCSALDYFKTKTNGVPGKYQGCLTRHLGINEGNLDWFVLFVVILTIIITWHARNFFK
jgi:hypothetical protein